MVYDFDYRTGRVRWERQVSAAPPSQPKHLKNSYASETPVTDGERVYFYFAGAGLFAFDLEGKALWSRPIGALKTRNNWGAAGSPALHGGRIYVVNDNDTQSFLAAFDARTGNELWRVNRTEGTNWSTPFVWEHAQRTEIVTSGSDRVRSYDTNGKLLWELTGMSTISIPTPFTRHGLLFLSSGYIGDALRPAYAIRPGASGDISLKPGETSNASIAWSSPTAAPYNPTPARGRGHLLHAVRPRVLYGPRRAHGQGNVCTAADHGRRQRIHVVALGVQRAHLRDERRRRHLRDSGRPRVQGARQELVERDDAGDAGCCARQFVHSYSNEALPSYQAQVTSASRLVVSRS